MKTVVLHEDKKTKVVAFYHGEDERLQYTRTYIRDEEGFVDKMVTVFLDGTVDVQ